MAQNTVRDLHRLAKALLPTNRDDLVLASKLPLYDAACNAAWQILTRKTEHNWFVQTSQDVNPALPNYFPDLQGGLREYPLPANLKTIRQIEPVNTIDMNLRFVPVKLNDESFRSDRQSQQQFDTQVKYDIIGVNPGTLVLARFPPRVIPVTMYYLRQRTKLVTIDDSLDDYPQDLLPLIADYVVKAHVLGIADPRFGAFTSQWAIQVEQFVGNDRRNNSMREVVEGYMEGWMALALTAGLSALSGLFSIYPALHSILC